MSLQCPKCSPCNITSKRHGMKTGALIGAVGGAARGLCAAISGASTGISVGALAGPASMTLGVSVGCHFWWFNRLYHWLPGRRQAGRGL